MEYIINGRQLFFRTTWHVIASAWVSKCNFWVIRDLEQVRSTEESPLNSVIIMYSILLR